MSEDNGFGAVLAGWVLLCVVLGSSITKMVREEYQREVTEQVFVVVILMIALSLIAPKRTEALRSWFRGLWKGRGE